MGWQRRLTKAYVTWGATLWVLCGCASSNEAAHKAQERKVLLRGQNLQDERLAHFEKVRLTTYEGELLPSDVQVAGVVLPRGFSPQFTFDYEWYYDGALPLPRLEKYFLARLEGGEVTRPDAVAILFARVRSRGQPAMQPVSVKIYPVPGRSDWSRIQILAPKPMPEHVPTAEEVRAILAERRARAH